MPFSQSLFILRGMLQAAKPGFRESFAWARGDGAEGAFTPEWCQGRAIFGGMLGAAMMQAMREEVEPDRKPRSFTATFAGPVEPASVRCEVGTLRSGRAATHRQGQLVQAGAVRFSATASFGADRDSSVRLDPPPRPEAVGPENVPEIPYLEGVVPVFVKRFELRWAEGEVPFSGAKRAGFAGWCRLREPAGPGDAEAILGLVDAWPAPVLALLKGPAPASSVTWSVDFLHDATNESANDWWYFQSRALVAQAGYASIEGTLWAPSGRAVAHSHQMVAIFG